MPDEDITSEWMIDNTWLVGSPQEVASKIRAIYEKVGGFGVLLTMAHEWEPRTEWERSNRLLAEEVMPMLSDLTGA